MRNLQAAELAAAVELLQGPRSAPLRLLLAHRTIAEARLRQAKKLGRERVVARIQERHGQVGSV